MRLLGIDSIEAANAWLPEFVALHNARFAVAPDDGRDAHTHYYGEAVALKRILAKQHERKLSKQLSCQFERNLIQTHFNTGGLGMRGATVTVLEHFDATIEVLWRTHSLAFTLTESKPRTPLVQVMNRKEVLLAVAPLKSRPKPLAPAKNHPWKTQQIGLVSPDFGHK